MADVTGFIHISSANLSIKCDAETSAFVDFCNLRFLWKRESIEEVRFRGKMILGSPVVSRTCFAMMGISEVSSCEQKMRYSVEYIGSHKMSLKFSSLLSK